MGALRLIKSPVLLPPLSLARPVEQLLAVIDMLLLLLLLRTFIEAAVVSNAFAC